MEEWTTAAEVTSFASLLRFPERNTTTLSPLRASEALNVERLDEPGVDDFIAKFFGEGIRPLVWFGAQRAEATTWRLLSALWPALRGDFSCCTFTLQPRSLDDRPFDLMFAPLTARSRFAEYLGAHEVSSARDTNVETWASEWKAQVFSGARSSDAGVADLCRGLDATPNAIRKVFLFVDLRERAKTAPLAAIGALDVLDSLGSVRNERSRISDLVTRAVEGTASAPATWALEVLCLVGLRLDRIESALIDPAIEELLARSVREYVERAPVESLQLAERFSTRDLGKLPRSFVRGLSEALARCASQENLAALAAATHVGLNILEVSPETAGKLLVAGRSFSAPFGDVLASWYADIRDPARRVDLRSVLIPEIARADEAPLLTELLRDVDVAELHTLIARAESRVVAPELGRLYMELVGERYPTEVMQLGERWHSTRQTAAGYMLAGAVPLTAGGLQEAVSLDETGFILAAVLDRALRKAPPQWIRPAAMEPAFWECALNGAGDEYSAGVLVRLVGTLDRSAIARTRNGQVAIERAPRPVQVHAVRAVLLDHLLGAASSDELHRWLATPWASSVLSRDASLLRSVVSDEVALGAEHFHQVWLGAWRTLEVVSGSVPDLGGAVFEICGLLLWRRPMPWPTEVTDIWRRLLRAPSRDPGRHEAACAYSLRFCFDNIRLPVGAVVAETFFPVHAAALRDQVRPSWDFFGWTNWDKGGELRRRLVDSFLHGEWDPHWFVFAAGQPWLLRKLCKRMLRQWKGQAFLERAFERLRAYPPSPLTHELADILRDPDYAVDWD